MTATLEPVTAAAPARGYVPVPVDRLIIERFPAGRWWAVVDVTTPTGVPLQVQSYGACHWLPDREFVVVRFTPHATMQYRHVPDGADHREFAPRWGRP